MSNLQIKTAVVIDGGSDTIKNREKMSEVMFEYFSIPGLCVCSSAMLSLYDTGRTTGLVIESGKEATHAVPIFKYNSITNAIQSLDAISGENITEYMCKILTERGYTFRMPSDRGIIQGIKEKLGYVSLDFNKEMSKVGDEIENNYELYESVITIANESFRCTEPIFSLSLMGLSYSCSPNIAHNSIMMSDTNIRRYLYSNIILSGGNTLFPGFAERIEKEIKHLALSDNQVKVISPPDRIYSAWRGGSTLASLDNFESLCIAKAEYEEVGPMMIHRKCF